MMLGLHEATWMVIAVASLCLVVFMTIGISLVHKSNAGAKWILRLASLELAACVVAAFLIAALERDCRMIDKAITNRLAAVGIHVISYSYWGLGNNTATISKNGCTATYEVLSMPDIRAGKYPLAPGTGRAVVGCNNVHRLDNVFLPHE
jgi:hypothetical protein